MALNRQQSGSILLFVGPPGTGKTEHRAEHCGSAAQKVCQSQFGRRRDEAEIRGHRRTYVGAMPGRIMEGMKRCASSNPVMVLDEVDKLSKDFSGDPYFSALLEVLDPEQNHTFTDHYMNVPYDLSDVLFVCTANTIDTIPEPLLNRMEVIQFQDTLQLKKSRSHGSICFQKAMKKMGVKAQNLKVTDAALQTVIRDYTMESGVRGLKSSWKRCAGMRR